MPGSSSWMPYAPQGVKGFDDDDDYDVHIHLSKLIQQNSVNPLAWDRRGAKLSNVLDYQMVPIPTQVLTGNFLLLLLYLDCTTGVFHPSSANSGPSGYSFVFLQVFTAEDVYGVAHDMSGDTVKFAVHVLGRLSEHDHKICPFQ
jgi:hypothetical protein